ncbi:MAG TPA: SAF domain-containing protein [Nocardioides sp.]|nr:SAF domain-containing protein [Nocardioides sp.]
MNPLRPVLRPLRRLHRRVLLHRRPLAALTVAGAVLVGLQAVAPAPPETVTVWTASRDLPSGTVLGEADLTGSPYSPDTVPANAVEDRRQVVGRTVAAPMSRGEVMTETRTVASGLLRGYPGATAVPLRVTDAAVVDLLRVGDRVSFVVADPGGRSTPTLLLRDVPVVAIPRANEGGPGSGTPGRLVVAAVPTGSANEVAARAATAILIPVWHR